MEKLRGVIAQHARWEVLLLYIDRIESQRDLDFSQALENAKALLESVCKEICQVCGKPLNSDSSMNGVLKNVFSVLGYSNSAMVQRISTSLASIGQEVGNLRNEISSIGHGKTLDEIRERNNKVDLLTREFLLNSISTVAVFLIRVFEDRHPLQGTAEVRLSHDYSDFEEFNDSWDDIFGEFTMGDYSYPASQILYYVDNQAYHYERKQLEENEEQP